MNLSLGLISRRFCEQLGLTRPIIQAPMAGVTTPEFVAKVSNHGVLGSYAAGYVTPEKLDADIIVIKSLTKAPFGVNLFASPPTPTRTIPDTDVQSILAAIAHELKASLNIQPIWIDHLDDHIDLVINHNVSIISVAFGYLNDEQMKRLKTAGIFTIGTATCLEEAHILTEKGFDAIVMQGSEAGGHRGGFLLEQKPVDLITLLAESEKISVPIIAAGGIATGAAIATALSCGASAVQIGTAFLTTHESGPHSLWKQKVVDAKKGDAVLTKVFSGKTGRALHNRFIELMQKFQQGLPSYPRQHMITMPLRAAATQQSNTDYMALWAGQSASSCRLESIESLLDRLS